jgi:hypothetical protein
VKICSPENISEELIQNKIKEKKEMESMKGQKKKKTRNIE